MVEKNDKLEEELQEFKQDLEKKEADTAQIDMHMEQMAYLWDKVHEKLKADNICFHTKKPLVAEGQDPKDVNIHILEANQTDPGIVAFVSISDEAMKELQELKEKEEEQKESVGEDK